MTPVPEAATPTPREIEALARRMAPMRYSWTLIAREATATQILEPGEPA